MKPPAVVRALLLQLMLVALHRLPSQAQQTAMSPNEQTMNLVEMMIKTMQTSACDGDQLRIQCPDEYVVDVITGELNVLPANGAASDTCSQSGPASSGPPAAGAAPISCISAQSRELGASDRAIVMQAIRTTCHLHNSCLLNLTSWASTSTSPDNNNNNSNNSTTQAVVGALQESSKALLQLLASKCPANRKLLEVGFKCRPAKLNKRFTCQGEPMKLECPPDRRLVVPSSSFGSSAADSKVIGKCEQQHSANTSLRAAPTIGGPSSSSSAAAAYRDCQSANGSAAVLHRCLLMQRCRLDVNPETLGEPTGCPAGQPLYLKVIYVCIPDYLLKDEYYRVSGRAGLEQATATATAGPQYILAAPPSPQLSQVSQSSRQEEHRFSLSGSASAAAAAAASPAAGQAASSGRYSSWASRVHQGLVLLTSQPSQHWQVIVFAAAGFSVSALLMALFVRYTGCLSPNEAMTAKDSHSSSSSSTSSSSSQRSNASTRSSNSFSTPGQPLLSHQSQHRLRNNLLKQASDAAHKQQRGSSNSESCFSLDDCHLADSSTPPACPNLQGPHYGVQQYPAAHECPPEPVDSCSLVLKPQRLCTIYGHGQLAHERLQPPLGTLRGAPTLGTAATQRSFFGGRPAQLPSVQQALILQQQQQQNSQQHQDNGMMYAEHQATLSWAPNNGPQQHAAELAHVNPSQAARCALHQPLQQQQFPQQILLQAAGSLPGGAMQPEPALEGAFSAGAALACATQTAPANSQPQPQQQHFMHGYSIQPAPPSARLGSPHQQ